MSNFKLSKSKRAKIAEKVSQTLQVIDDSEVSPTNISVKFKYQRGSMPENINHLMHYAKALGLIVEERHGELVFNLDELNV